jgi:CNT family concentrative nucleoside transporter
MERFQGLIGIVLILGIAWAASNDRKRINYRLVGSGLLLQLILAVLVLKVPPVTRFFQSIGHGMQKIEEFARAGAAFAYGGIGVQQLDGGIADYMKGGFVFAFNITATIILVCVLVAIFYHVGVMQRAVSSLPRHELRDARERCRSLEQRGQRLRGPGGGPGDDPPLPQGHDPQ